MEVTANVVETTRELELAVEPKDVTELLQSHYKTLRDVLWPSDSVSWNIVPYTKRSQVQFLLRAHA